MRGMLIVAGLLAVAGCVPSLKSDEPPMRIYWLQTPTQEHTAAPPTALRVTVVPGLDSDRLWILQRDRRLNYYAGAYWPDSLQPLLQSVIERSFDFSSSPAGGLAFDILVERFFAVESAAGDIPTVELKARIHRTDVISPVCPFEVRAQPDTGRLRDIVAAHQQVLAELTRELNRLIMLAASGQPFAC